MDLPVSEAQDPNGEPHEQTDGSLQLHGPINSHESQPTTFRKPLVLTNISLRKFIEYVVERHAAPTTLVICSDQQSFLQQLLRSAKQNEAELNNETPPNTTSEQAQDELTSPSSKPRIKSYLLTRPLNLLSASRTVRLAFCPSLPVLQAYLTSIPQPENGIVRDGRATTEDHIPFLGLVNPIALHRETSSFSAQGIGKTFAMAVEASYRGSQRLTIVECPEINPRRLDSGEGEDVDINISDSNGEPADAGEENENGLEEHKPPPGPLENVWEEDIPILSSNTKAYGAPSGRGWLGRSIKIIDVARRWCSIEKYSECDMPQ